VQQEDFPELKEHNSLLVAVSPQLMMMLEKPAAQA
jgi:hypothetical protein